MAKQIKTGRLIIVYWVCFGDSAKGILSMKRNDIAPEITNDHIISLYDDFSRGDIRDVEKPEKRLSIIMPWEDDPELDGEWIRDYISRHFDSLKQLEDIDEAIIWCGTNAQEQCGVRYVASRLSGRGIPVQLVRVETIPASEIHWGETGSATAIGVIVTTKKGRRIPVPGILKPLIYRRVQNKIRRERGRKGTVVYSGSGEMDLESVRYFYEHRRRLDENELLALANEWRVLQNENAPLRAVVDGEVRSVPEDFYDEVILSCAPEKEDIAATMVGRAIPEIVNRTGNYIGDMQIFSRIRALAETGRLEILRDAPSYREMRVRKSA